jgi:hypothetical protein
MAKDINTCNNKIAHIQPTVGFNGRFSAQVSEATITPLTTSITARNGSSLAPFFFLFKKCDYF